MKTILSLLALVFVFTAVRPVEAAPRRRRAPARRCAFYNIPGLRAALCSPLVIQFSNNPEQIDLSSINDGVLLDILGIPGQKQKISWFTMQSASFNYFLTLPDERGNVHGINELFGNN